MMQQGQPYVAAPVFYYVPSIGKNSLIPLRNRKRFMIVYHFCANQITNIEHSLFFADIFG